MKVLFVELVVMMSSGNVGIVGDVDENWVKNNWVELVEKL